MTIQVSDITAKNFKSKLAGFKNSMLTQRDNLQEFLEFGLLHYKENGNTVYLSQTLNVCVGVKALPTNAIKEYIKEHANVQWKKNKDGDMVFKKVGKQVEVTMPSVIWYNSKHVAKDQAKADMDVLARTKSLLTSLTKALNDGHVKEGQHEIAIKIQKDLEGLLTA